MPTVSLVMSVYNDAARVGRAIESIAAQSWRDWELIVVNDGSTDATGRIVDERAAGDGRIRVLHQENRGLTRALICGCHEARGEFIARQDADDWSHPQRLAEQVAYLRRHAEVGFVSCWTDYVGPRGEPLDTVQRPHDPGEATERLLNERLGPPAHGSVMFRKALYEAVGGYRPEFYYGQDSDLWLRMAERMKIGYVPLALYECCRTPTSISGARRSLQQRFGELGQACRRARLAGESEAPFLAEAAVLTETLRSRPGESGRTQRDVAAMQYLIGSQLVANGDRRAAGYLWNVVRQQPWHWKAWARLLQSRLLHREFRS